MSFAGRTLDLRVPWLEATLVAAPPGSTTAKALLAAPPGSAEWAVAAPLASVTLGVAGSGRSSVDGVALLFLERYKIGRLSFGQIKP